MNNHPIELSKQVAAIFRVFIYVRSISYAIRESRISWIFRLVTRSIRM